MLSLGVAGVKFIQDLCTIFYNFYVKQIVSFFVESRKKERGKEVLIFLI